MWIRAGHNEPVDLNRDINAMRQMKKTKELIVLTVNSDAALGAQDAESCQQLLKLKERQEVIETLRKRLASRGRKKERTAEAFFAEFFSKKKIPYT